MIKSVFRRLTAAVTLLLVGYVLYLSVTDMYFCYLSGSTGHLTWILAAAAFVLAALLLLFAGRAAKLSDRSASIGTGIAFGLMVLLQLTLIFIAFRHYLPWADSLSVMNEAISMSASSRPAVSSAGRYFEMYGNNYFFTILLCYYFRFFRLFGLTAYWTEALLLNLAVMDAGVLCCIFAARRIFDARRGLLLAVLCLLNPLLYVFLPFVYTNTISIGFTMGIFCLALFLFQEKRPSRRLLYTVLEAVLLVIGFQIRVTTLIPAIALLFYRWLKGRAKLSDQERVSNLERRRLTVVFALVFVLLFAGCRMLIGSHVSGELRARNFPVTHWVMMGLQGDGGYFSPDEDFTYQYTEKSDKVTANLEEIRFRLDALADLGPAGVLDFIGRKITTTWASEMDGLYLETGRMQAYNPLQKYLFGFKNDLLLYYYQFFKIMLYAFCMLAILRELTAKQLRWSYSYILTLLGFFVFYLLWEANCRYAICLTLIFVMLALDGMDWVSGFGISSEVPRQSFVWRLRAKQAAGLFLAVGILLPCIYAMYRQYPTYTEHFIPKVDYSVITVGRSYHEAVVDDLVTEEHTLTQTFTTAHPFNEVGIYCSYSGTEEWSDKFKEEKAYRFRLLDASGQVLAEETFGPEDNRKYYKLFGFDLVTPDSSSVYTIEISPSGDSDADRLGFVYFDFDTYDYIAHADLSVDGQRLNRDLIFMVDYGYSGPYTTPARYLTVCAALVLLLALTALLLLTNRRPRGKFFSFLFGTELIQCGQEPTEVTVQERSEFHGNSE